MAKMILLNEVEGVEKLISLYKTDSETTSGEFADYIVIHFGEFFEETQDKFLAMLCIQKFRAWDWEESYGNEIETEINWIYSKEEGLCINEFQDFVFELSPNRFIPDGVRIGFEDEQGELLLDAGIQYASESRQNHEILALINRGYQIEKIYFDTDMKCYMVG